EEQRDVGRIPGDAPGERPEEQRRYREIEDERAECLQPGVPDPADPCRAIPEQDEGEDREDGLKSCRQDPQGAYPSASCRNSSLPGSLSSSAMSCRSHM